MPGLLASETLLEQSALCRPLARGAGAVGSFPQLRLNMEPGPFSFLGAMTWRKENPQAFEVSGKGCFEVMACQDCQGKSNQQVNL